MSTAAITAWRIVKRKHVDNAFDGEGARRFGGRWNSVGVPMVYVAGSQALAVLEMLVHLNDSDLLRQYRLVPVTFDEGMVETMDIGKLPDNWKHRPAPRGVRAIGDGWAASGRSAVLRIPSVIVPSESNYLMNPLHVDFAKVKMGKPQPYRFDPRLK